MVENNGLEFRNDGSIPDGGAAEECCTGLPNSVANAMDNECTAGIGSGGAPATFPLSDACYYYSQYLQEAGDSGSGGGLTLDPADAGQWVGVFGDAANSILNLFGLGYQPPPPGGVLSPEDQKSKQTGLILLGTIVLVAVGFAIYAVTRKKR